MLDAPIEAHTPRRKGSMLPSAEVAALVSLVRAHPEAPLAEVTRLLNIQVQGTRDPKTVRKAIEWAGLPAPPSGSFQGRPPLLSPALVAQAVALAMAMPRASVGELLVALREGSGADCGVATLDVALRKKGIVRPKGRDTRDTAAPDGSEERSAAYASPPPEADASRSPRIRGFDEADLAVLRVIVQENPFFGADNLSKLFSSRIGRRITDTTVRRALEAMGWRRKVRPFAEPSAAPEKDPTRYTDAHRPGFVPRQPTSYPSDLTDAEWDILEPHLRGRRQTSPCGESTRATMNAILYMARTGCQWRFLPHDFPEWNSVAQTYYRWMRRGVFSKVNDALRRQVRIAANRDPEPSAASIDSQSVKTTEKGGSTDMTVVRRSMEGSAIFL